MARRILAVLGRARHDGGSAHESVHFHQGPAGTPAVCHDQRCSSPRLRVEAGDRPRG